MQWWHCSIIAQTGKAMPPEWSSLKGFGEGGTTTIPGRYVGRFKVISDVTVEQGACGLVCHSHSDANCLQLFPTRSNR